MSPRDRAGLLSQRNPVPRAIPRSARRVAVCAAGVLAFALLTALGAHVRVPLPGTPVPMTLQTLAVLLAGITLGPRLASASMTCYLLLGIGGVPVFAAADHANGLLLGATGGYLLGFVAAQPTIGLVMSRLAARGAPAASFAGALAGTLMIFSCGLVWLGAWLNLDAARALELGLWPFAVGEVLKVGLASAAGLLTRPAWRRLAGGHDPA